MDSDENLHLAQDHYLSIQQDSTARRGQVEMITESVALGLLFLASFLENGIICTVLLQENRRSTISNLLLISLASANFFISVLVTPFVLASVISDTWVFGSIWCEVSGFLVNFLSTASDLSITSIAVYRYYLVVKPLAVKITLRRARRMTGFVWFTSLIFALPPLVGWNMYGYSPGKGYCTLTWKSGGPALVYSACRVCVTFIIPLIIILCMYRAIYTKVKEQRKITGYNTPRALGTNGFLKHSTSALDNQQLVCGCFPKCVVVHNSDYYERRNPEVISSVSSASLSFDSSSQNSPVRRVEEARKKQNISRHSSIIQQRTFQSASAIVISFIVCSTPYFIQNLWSGFGNATPPYVIDFVTSWLYLSLTAVNPITYGHSNRDIIRAVRTLPVLRRLFRERQQRRLNADPRTIRPGNISVNRAHRNEALDVENTA